MAESGLVLLAGLWGGMLPLTAQALALMLGGAVIFLSSGYEVPRPWLSIAPVLGVVSVLGAPLTAGWMGAGGIFQVLISSGNWPVLVGVVAADVILAAGLFRVALCPGELAENTAVALGAYLGGLILPVGVLVAVGWPGAGWIRASIGAGTPAPGLWAGIAVLVTVAVGLGLWRFEALARGPANVAVEALSALFRLDWLYRLVWSGFHFLAAVVFNIAAVLEGEGAVLWALAAIMLLWLAFR